MNKARLKEIYSQYYAGEFSPKESEVSDLFGMIDELEKQLGAEQRRLHEQDTQVAVLREALEQIRNLVDTDNMISETEDGEKEYWINHADVVHIVDEALAEEEPCQHEIRHFLDTCDLCGETVEETPALREPKED